VKRSLFAELRRRNVFKAGAAYLALGWVVVQITATLVPALNLPPSLVPTVTWIGVIGFPFVIMFSWIYELTPEGLKRESEVDRSGSITHVTGRRLDYIIIGLLVLAIGLFAFDRFMVTPWREAVRAATSRTEASSHSAQRDKPDAAGSIPEIESDPSIAVLPLVNMSSDREQDYFSDGISEELLNLLAKVQKLRVIARTSSFAFKGQNLEIPEIARRLHVAAVLEGSVRKSGDKVRITAQLIRANDGSHLWSDTYDRTLDDIFKVQDEIAAAVVEQLQIKLLGPGPISKPVDPKAYPLILQALALSDQSTAASRAQSIAVYQQALAIAPNEPRAWDGLARVYFNQALFGERSVNEGERLSKAAATKALDVDPANVIALAGLGRIAADFDLDLPSAARYYQRALDREPGNLVVINSAAVLLMYTGRTAEAQMLLEYRTVHDPANATAYNNLASSEYNARHWDASIDAGRTAVRLSPNASGARNGIGLAMLVGKHDAVGAMKEFEAEPDEPSRMQGVAAALHTLGRISEADAALQAFVDKYGSDQPVAIATVYAWRGATDSAFEWLEKAAAIHDLAVGATLVEPMFDSMHGDARWLPYLRKIGYAPEELSKIDFKVTLPQAEVAAASGGANH
jgi:TolB-like protein/Flp pilus assembly protein TadD